MIFLLNKKIRFHYATYLDTHNRKKVPQLATLNHILTLKNIHAHLLLLRRRGQMVDIENFYPSHRLLTTYLHYDIMDMRWRWTQSPHSKRRI